MVEVRRPYGSEPSLGCKPLRRRFEVKGHLFLIYPQTKSFTAALSPFLFSDDLVLWVVPFYLDKDPLAATPGGLPVSWAGGESITDGAWQDNQPLEAPATANVETQTL